MKRFFLACCFALGASLFCMAQIEAETHNIFQKVKKIVDDKTVVHGVDTNYVKTPKQPWQISIKSRVSQTDLQMHSVINGETVFDGEFLDPNFKAVGNLHTDPRILTDISTSLGIKVGYRGLSASFSLPVWGDKSTNISLRSMSNRFCLNFRWHKFKTDYPRIKFSGNMVTRDPTTGDFDYSELYEFELDEKMELDDPINIQTMVFDGFYIFNYKKFSYAAAYNQKMYQVRSAGSLVAGLMCYYSDFKFNSSRNADFIITMGDIGRLRQYQVNLGVGYSYNFVPCKGWLLNATVMPTVSVVNRTKVNYYGSNAKAIDQLHKDDPDDLDYSDEYKLWNEGEKSKNNRVALNYNARVSLTYSWDRFFINAHGQFNNFHYKHSSLSGHLNDWYVNTSMGVRF